MNNRKGGLSIDPEVAAWQKTAATNSAALTGKQKRDAQRVRIAYDVDLEVKAAISRIAKYEDTSASQVGNLLLAKALHDYARMPEPLTDLMRENKIPARTLQFSWKLRLPDGWTELFRRILPDGNTGR